jgi:uncharacterized protein YjeT (DUF2065 family)
LLNDLWNYIWFAFLAAGMYMIITQRGWKALSKSHEEVHGNEARTNGLILLVMGLVILAIMLFVK